MKRRLLLAGVLGLVAGVGGETLLFMQRQSRLIEDSLREDFRIMLYFKGDPDEGRQKVVEEKLRAFDEVDDVRLVSRQEQLAALRRDDPELVDSVLLVGENPLAPAFEVRLIDEAIPRVTQWLLKAEALAEFADVRYKPSQVQALLQARFYSRFLDLAVALLVCVCALVALAGLWALRGHKPPTWRTALSVIAAAGGGAAAGAAMVCLMVLPMRTVSLWWQWPAPSAQFALVFGAAAAGWVLCARAD